MSVEEQLNHCPRCREPVMIWSQAINCKTCRNQYHLDCLLQGCLQGCIETTWEPNASCQVTSLKTHLGALVATSSEPMTRNEPRNQENEPSDGEDTAECASKPAQSTDSPSHPTPPACPPLDVDFDTSATYRSPHLGAVAGANPTGTAVNASCSRPCQDVPYANNNLARKPQAAHGNPEPTSRRHRRHGRSTQVAPCRTRPHFVMYHAVVVLCPGCYQIRNR